MTYATQADLEERFGVTELAELTDRVNGEVIDSGVVTLALNDAQAEIDGYLAARYALPLATVPSILVRLCCDMARYYLYDDRVTESVRNRYTDAVKVLRSISAGDVKIDALAPLVACAALNEVQLLPPSRPTVFGRSR